MPTRHPLGLVTLATRVVVRAESWVRFPRPRRFSAFAALLLLALVATASRVATGGDASGSAETAQSKLPHADFEFGEPRMSVGFRGGWAFNRSDGEIYDFLTDELTLEKSDFDAPAFIFDFSWRLLSWLDVVLGAEYSGRKRDSEDRHFVEVGGRPIEQSTRLTQVPLSVSFRIYPIGRGKQVGTYAWIRKAVVPYVGGGIGATWYELKQKGDFVDVGDPNVIGDEVIFSDVFKSDDWTFAQHVFAGLDIRLTRSLGLVLEGRYYWANADLQGDYVGFSDIDLDGARLMIGFNWKL